MTEDSGFAPHIKDKWISLACCARFIRKDSNVGDFVLGVSGKTMANVPEHIPIYLMQVDEKLTFDEYFRDPRFVNRVDNIYYLKKDGKYIQDSTRRHVKDKGYTTFHENKDDTKISKFVLLSRNSNFYYFGNYWKSDDKLRKMMNKFCEKVRYYYKPYGRHYKESRMYKEIRSNERDVKNLLRFIKKYPCGKIGEPNRLPDDTQKSKCHKHQKRLRCVY